MVQKAIFILLLILSTYVRGEASIPGESSALEYVSGSGDVYRSLRFRRDDGTMFTPFDEGLRS